MAGRSRSSSAKLVNTITRAFGSFCRSSRIAPTPSSTGMTRSIRITSGVSSSASVIACRPSSASPTTSIPSCSSRNVRNPSRTTAWSSTSNTRIDSATRGHLQLDLGSAARRGVDLEPPAEAARPLLHRREPEPSRAQLGVVRLEAHAVVRHLEGELPVVASESDLHVLRARVLHRVLQCLLGDAEDLLVATVAAGRHGVVDLQLDLHAVELAQHLDVLAQGAAEAVALEVRRAQLE